MRNKLGDERRRNLTVIQQLEVEGGEERVLSHITPVSLHKRRPISVVSHEAKGISHLAAAKSLSGLLLQQLSNAITSARAQSDRDPKNILKHLGEAKLQFPLKRL